jgi:hypothetical protein
MRANILTRVMSWPALVFTFCTWWVARGTGALAASWPAA